MNRPNSRRTRSGPSCSGIVLLALSGPGALGCGASGADCGGAAACDGGDPLELATWWGTRGELYASFDILKRSYQSESHRAVELAHLLQNKQDHTHWVEQRLGQVDAGVPPLDVFSANNGDEVLRWTACAGWGPPPSSAKLVGLTDPASSAIYLRPDWIATTFEPRVMETLQCQGETYALPVGVHRINTLFYNKALFRAAGYAVDGGDGTPLPTSIDELNTAVSAVTLQLPEGNSPSDLPPSAFAIAGHESWTLSLFMIENVMLSLAGSAERYENYWRGKACDEALLASTLRELAQLRPHFGSWELIASEALGRVMSGRAAMMVTGDWAAAEIDPDVVGSMPFPGTAQYFVFSADVFALPALGESPAKGLAWLRAVTERETQRDFSLEKSALSARIDLEEERFAPGEAPEFWVRSLPALLPYHPEAAFASLQEQLGLWLRSPDDAALLAYARQQYRALSGGSVVCPEPEGTPSVDITDIQ